MEIDKLVEEILPSLGTCCFCMDEDPCSCESQRETCQDLLKDAIRSGKLVVPNEWVKIRDGLGTEREGFLVGKTHHRENMLKTNGE